MNQDQTVSRAAFATRRAARVSVIVPLYNHDRYIARAVRSVQEQGTIIGEIIVIDDGSTDKSASEMARLARLDPRIIFWTHPNRGAAATINAGMMRASHEYIAILNSDDVFAAERVHRLVAVLDRTPGVDLAASAVAFIDNEGKSITNEWYDTAIKFYRSGVDLGLALMNGNFLISTSNFLFRRKILDFTGLFSPLRYAHDLDFLLRLAVKHKRIFVLEESLLYYRFHDRNTINEDHTKVKLEWAIVSAFFLHRRWAAPREPFSWTSVPIALDILERHGLVRAVVLALTYFRRHPTDTLERSPILCDRTFHQLLMENLA